MSNAVLTLLAFAAAGRVALAGDVVPQLLVLAAFRGLSLFSIRHDKDSAGSKESLVELDKFVGSSGILGGAR
jgi:hypothetical protein